MRHKQVSFANPPDQHQLEQQSSDEVNKSAEGSSGMEEPSKSVSSGRLEGEDSVVISASEYQRLKALVTPSNSAVQIVGDHAVIQNEEYDRLTWAAEYHEGRTSSNDSTAPEWNLKERAHSKGLIPSKLQTNVSSGDEGPIGGGNRSFGLDYSTGDSNRTGFSLSTDQSSPFDHMSPSTVGTGTSGGHVKHFGSVLEEENVLDSLPTPPDAINASEVLLLEETVNANEPDCKNDPQTTEREALVEDTNLSDPAPSASSSARSTPAKKRQQAIRTSFISSKESKEPAKASVNEEWSDMNQSTTRMDTLGEVTEAAASEITNDAPSSPTMWKDTADVLAPVDHKSADLQPPSSSPHEVSSSPPASQGNLKWLLDRREVDNSPQAQQARERRLSLRRNSCPTVGSLERDFQKDGSSDRLEQSSMADQVHESEEMKKTHSTHNIPAPETSTTSKELNTLQSAAVLEQQPAGRPSKMKQMIVPKLSTSINSKPSALHRQQSEPMMKRAGCEDPSPKEGNLGPRFLQELVASNPLHEGFRPGPAKTSDSTAHVERGPSCEKLSEVGKEAKEGEQKESQSESSKQKSADSQAPKIIDGMAIAKATRVDEGTTRTEGGEGTTSAKGPATMKALRRPDERFALLTPKAMMHESAEPKQVADAISSNSSSAEETDDDVSSSSDAESLAEAKVLSAKPETRNANA